MADTNEDGGGETATKWDILHETFTPTQPVKTRDIFAGRTNQLFECLSIADQIGAHGILFGERGVGKTSIANITRIILDTPDNYARAIKIDCVSADSFPDLIRHIYEKIEIEVHVPAMVGFHADPEGGFAKAPLASRVNKRTSFNPKHVAQVLGSLPGKLLIILDEFDRLRPGKFDLASFTELLKIISDNGYKTQFLIVGVGDTVAQIIGEHQSITRNLTQIHLNPMSDAEIREIVSKGIERIEVSMGKGIIDQIVAFSCGYPHYTHLLCLQACTNALHRENDGRGAEVGQADLDYAISKALDKAQESLKQSYRQATMANRQNIFKEVLQACGKVELDSYNMFQPKDLEKHLSAILKREMKATQFGSHLIKLCSEERGQILINVGDRGRSRYRFRDPLMRAYVKMSTAARR